MLVDLDDLLFASQEWFALGASNERVAGVIVPTLRDGLDLIGEGAVRAVVGRLRPEVRVVDVDLAGPRGDAAVELVTAWCRTRQLWHLVRPSGGALGRHHVFVAVGAGMPGAQALENLEAHLGEVRQQLRCARQGVDLRQTVRPLSSPHRNGTFTRVYGAASEALLGLRRHPWASGAPTVSRRRRGGGSVAAAAQPRRRRPRREPPEAWRAYLEHGARPLIRVDATQSRSNYEAAATAALIRCGYGAEEAWQAIADAHPQSFTKARGKGRSWWVRYVWNPAVLDDDAFVAAPRQNGAVSAAAAAAVTALEQLAWSLPPRRRATVLLVGRAILDRVLRTQERRVPVPERNLALDTGLQDRKTIRAALKALHGPVGVLHTEAWDPNRRDQSSFEFEIPEAQGVTQIPPPSLHTPSPAGAWAALPRLCPQLWRALTDANQPLCLPKLARRALVPDTPSSDLTDRQVRTVRAALTALAEAGLVSCSAEGTWVASRRVAPEFAERAAARRTEQERVVALEREAYRVATPSAWSVARAASLKAQRAREVAWWRGLDPVERQHRRDRAVAAFTARPVLEQERLKTELADRRRRHGVDEAARYRAWLIGLSDDELTVRSVTRAAMFATLAPPLQQALVASWQRHRDRYGLLRSSEPAARIEQRELLPVSVEVRDRRYWEQQIIEPSTSELLA